LIKDEEDSFETIQCKKTTKAKRNKRKKGKAKKVMIKIRNCRCLKKIKYLKIEE